MKRKVTDEQLRKVVLARITKGDTFRYDFVTCIERQKATSAELSTMSRAEIYQAYPYATYDLI